MDQPDEFTPKPSETTLVVQSKDLVTIAEVKHAVRMVLAKVYRFPVAMMMAHALNYNYYSCRNRRRRAILITADSSPLADAIILDLCARLCHQSSQICVRGQLCSVTFDGRADQSRLNALTLHHFWISSAFDETTPRAGERFNLN